MSDGTRRYLAARAARGRGYRPKWPLSPWPMDQWSWLRKEWGFMGHGWAVGAEEVGASGGFRGEWMGSGHQWGIGRGGVEIG